MTAWLLQAVGLPSTYTLSKTKGIRIKTPILIKKKKITRIGLFAIKEKDGDTL